MLSIDEAKAYLEAVDLTYLIDTMTSKHYPLPRWTREDATRALRHYKNFLWLFKRYPDQPLVPTKEIDECWHNHILHTKRYSADCEQLFGYYLHHHPATPGEDDATLAANYLHTKELYLNEFKQPMHSK